ncbi:MAG: small multi-drug export protein [Bacteroides sp.]|nr:small multi-drug export protein [[Eubacterium] siraeum]MCM1454934.1 small multi-drug export protein [Bacteroides sp.]
MDGIIDFFRSVFNNDYLTLYVISIIPIIELRGAIVFMTGMFGSVQEMIAGMFCCVAGSTTVILPLILIVRPLIRRMKRSKLLSKAARGLETSIEGRAESAYSEEKEEMKRLKGGRKKHKRKPLSKDAKKFLGLFAFVAVPLPMTGAWTGSCVGSFLDFPVWKAALAVFFGNVVAASILTTLAYFMPKQYADLFMYAFLALAVAIICISCLVKMKKVKVSKTL